MTLSPILLKPFMSVPSNSSCLPCVLLEICFPVSHLYAVAWSWAIILLQVLTQKLCSLSPLSFPSLPFKCVLVAQSCPALWDPMDYSLPGSFFHGIIQARILEWVAILFSRGSPQPRDRTQVYRITGGFFTNWATREDQSLSNNSVLFAQ